VFSMKSEPMPHEKMSEDEIKAAICNLQSCAINGQQSHPNLATFDYMEKLITKLKKHFCPEKFMVTKITLGELKSIYDLDRDGYKVSDFDNEEIKKLVSKPEYLPMDMTVPGRPTDQSKFLSEPRRMTRPDERKD